MEADAKAFFDEEKNAKEKRNANVKRTLKDGAKQGGKRARKFE